MDEFKQKAIDKAVTHSRNVMSNMGHVTANDEVIAWQADQIIELKEQLKKQCRSTAALAYGSDIYEENSEESELISTLGLHKLTEACLKAEGITWIGELTLWTAKKLIATPNIGLKRLREIERSLSSKDLALAND